VQQPKIYHATDHDIDSSQVDADAIFVINRLREAGFKAYLVGGGVRDLLIKCTPKDFDISTSAKPEQIKQLFSRNCLLIGRRFRLAHVRFGHKILEVSTFRSGIDDDDLIVHDNQWGTEEQDVLRRDFTINGLFYDPATHTVIDYVGGWEDIHKRILRTIGDPITRFRQDPVRMIRLLKFRARFGFEIESDARKALILCREEIIKSSPARVLEEFLRMLESGASAPFFHLMSESGILSLLFPPLNNFLQGKDGIEIYRLLTSADKINKSNVKRPLDRALLTTCLIFPILEKELQIQFTDKDKAPHIGDIILLTSSIIHTVLISSFSHFPRRITAIVSFILAMQYKLTPLSNKRQHRPKIARHRDFELALGFLKLRAYANESLMDTYAQWRTLFKSQEKHGDRRAHNPAPHSRH
jgi:poly(A) polymerase